MPDVTDRLPSNSVPEVTYAKGTIDPAIGQVYDPEATTDSLWSEAAGTASTRLLTEKGNRLSRPKQKIVQAGGAIFVALLTLIFGTATPASATHIQDEVAGAGAGQGWEYGNEAVGGPRPATGCEENPLSAELTSRFEIDHQGDYTGVDNPGHPLATPVAYVGPSHVKVQTDRYVASPLGTHDPNC